MLSTLHAFNLEKTRVFVLYDANVDSYIEQSVKPRLDSRGYQVNYLPIEASEGIKSLRSATEICEWLASLHCSRHDLIINVGGGAITDLGGFVAAIYKRGVWSINIPTTILGMVDAAIGGKTAVNVEHIKNCVGQFHWPIATITDLAALEDLPMKEVQNGWFELMKTLLLFGTLEDIYLAAKVYQVYDRAKSIKAFSPDEQRVLSRLINKVQQMKMKVVDADPYDDFPGQRGLLNFGHTFGHVFEATAIDKGKPMGHGTAVAYGILYMLYNSEHIELFKHVRTLFKSIGLQIPETVDYDLKYLYNDKKAGTSGIDVVTLRGIGQPWSERISFERLANMLATTNLNNNVRTINA